MRAFLILPVLFIFASCGQNMNSNNQLMLNPEITKLDDVCDKVVKDWDAYGDLENNLKLICTTNPLNATSFREPLLHNVKAMEEHIPKPLNTRSVQKCLKIIDTRIVSFYREVEEDELNERIIEQHVSAIMNAFGELNQSLNKSQVHLN